MRFTCLSTLLIVASFAAPIARAEFRLPVKTVICYDSPGLSEWSYRASGNSVDGVYERRGYVWLNFAQGRSSDGHIIGTHVTHPVAGLKWDSAFRNIMASDESGRTHVVCGTRKWYGMRKYEEACELRGRLVPNGPCPEICGDEPSYLFEGELIVHD